MSETRRPPRWPIVVLAAPAFVAVWSGWVGLGQLTGFGVVRPLPGTPWSEWELDTSITLSIGMETYAAYALWVWLSAGVPERARVFARVSAIGSLVLGAAGQVGYHLMTAAGVTEAPWPITAAVACLPVAVLGMGAALAHLLHEDGLDMDMSGVDSEPVPAPAGVDTRTDSVTDSDSVTGPDSDLDTSPDMEPDTGPDTTPAATVDTEPDSDADTDLDNPQVSPRMSSPDVRADDPVVTPIRKRRATVEDYLDDLLAKRISQAEVARRVKVSTKTVQREVRKARQERTKATEAAR